MGVSQLYADIYYENTWGYYPYDSDENYEKTRTMFQSLVDAGIGKAHLKDIVGLLGETKKTYLSHEEMPQYLWEGSLLEKGKFYYHPLLQVRSPKPKLNPETGKVLRSPYYLELKIQYSMDELLSYVWGAARIPHELREQSRDKGAIEFLLNKYQRISEVEPIDFLLFLVDEAKSQDVRLTSILDLTDYELETLESVKKMTAEAKIKGVSEVRWRL